MFTISVSAQANVNTVNQLSRDAFGKSLGESSQLEESEESVNHFVSNKNTKKYISFLFEVMKG